MRNFLVLTALFLGLVGVSVAQHGAHGNPPSSPHSFSPPQQHQQHENRPEPPRGIYQGHDHDRGQQGYHDRDHHDYRGGYGGWYAGRPEYRGFHWGHYYGWRDRRYMYLGSNYCYVGTWGGPYFTFGFNASRWRVLDFDLAIANGWYPGGCAYVESDPYHDGWYLLYDQQTGQYVHVEQY